jgi:hypothetical protein
MLNSGRGRGIAAALAAALTTGAAIVMIATVGEAGAASAVRSSLDGKTVLPHRILWNAYPSTPSSRIKEVDFLIDGTTRWIEHHRPYSYADGDGLVTTWLTAGAHRFTVRAIETGGARSEDTVTAKVLAAPAPPAELAGKWHRTVDTSSLHNPPGIENPSGTYTLTFDPRWIRANFPGRFVPGTGPNSSNDNGHGWIIDAYGVYNASTIKIEGAVNYQPMLDTHRQGGYWCGPSKPAAYHWAVTGNTLTLTLVGSDSCAGRKFIWSGDWTRG